MFVTKRDLAVAAMTACCTISALAVSSHPEFMDSSVFDWNNTAVRSTTTGSYKNFFRARTATLQELECHATTLNAGESAHPAHRHPEEELLIVKEGTLETLVNGEKKKAGPGSVIFYASNQQHMIQNAGTTPASFHIISWKSTETPKK